MTGQGNVALNVIFRHKGKGTRVSVLPGMFQFCHQKQKIRKNDSGEKADKGEDDE